MKKIGTAAGLAALTIVVAVLSGAALANGTHGAAKSESASSGSKPSEPAAKVYICHATGSASNPYVLIHVSSHALPAHAGHQGGHDLVLGSSPGACPQPATAAGVKAAEQTQVAPTVKSQEQSDNASAPKANESEQNDAAEASDQSESASEQGEASDQNESASDEDKSSSSEQQVRSHDDNGGDSSQHASDQSGD